MIPIRVPTYILFGWLELEFQLKGPGASLCPKCGFFLGFEKGIEWEHQIYHATCISCENCRSRLAGTTYKIRKDREVRSFYCNRCHDKKFGDDPNFQVSTTTNVILSKLGRDFDSPHTFEETEPGHLSRCDFCGGNLMKAKNALKGTTAYSCSGCKYHCHKECKDFIPDDCSKDAKTCISHSSTESDIKKGYRKSISKVKSFGVTRNNKAVDKSVLQQDLASLTVSSPILVASPIELTPEEPTPSPSPGSSSSNIRKLAQSSGKVSQSSPDVRASKSSSQRTKTPRTKDKKTS